MSSRKLLLVLTGGIVLSAGWAIAATSIFAQDFLLSYAGLLLVYAGFKLTQFGEHGEPDAGLEELRTAIAAAAGIALITMGFVNGASSVENPGTGSLLASGLMVVAGYMIAHTHETGVLM